MHVIMAKRILSLILLLSLVLPMGIGFVHAFHDHDSTVCSALGEQHFHKDSAECEQLHFFIQTSDFKVWAEITIPEAQWACIDQVISEKSFTVSFYKADPDRGPPAFNVL